MFSLSWLGFYPQAVFIGLATIVAVALAGLRWEAVALLVAAVGTGMGALIKLVVYRPRPSADLVHVFAQLPSSGFPSGHVLSFTAFCGFLVFLCYSVLKPSVGRTIGITILSLVIGLMGVSRIYLGQHWFSDVMGAYLFGSLWLALTIKIYRWGKLRFFVHQPVAPEVPAISAAPAPAAAGKG
jgi:undecaprenyl-diphosphatase